MIIRRSRFGAFGMASTYQAKDCPSSGSWESWCDCMFPAGSQLNAQCRQPSPGVACVYQPWNGHCYAPWTDAGSAARGLPKDAGVVGAIFTSGAAQQAGEAAMTQITNAVNPQPAAPEIQTYLPTIARDALLTRGRSTLAPSTQTSGGIGGTPSWALFAGAALLAGGIALYLKKRRRGASAGV